METKNEHKNKGGRPPKFPADRATVKVNCWVTTAERQTLQTAFEQFRAGRKVAFADFLKQKLLTDKADKPATESVLLTLLIQIQQQGRQVAQLITHIERDKPGENWHEIAGQLRQEADRIRETLIQISSWLYES